jgi:hypothetical protein
LASADVVAAVFAAEVFVVVWLTVVSPRLSKGEFDEEECVWKPIAPVC